MPFAKTLAITLGSKASAYVLHANIYQEDGVTLIAGPITAGFVNLGGGDFLFLYPTFPDGVATVVKFYNAADVYQAFSLVDASDSLNELRIRGTVTDATPLVGQFKGDSSLSSQDNFYNGCVVVFVSGDLHGIPRKVSTYVGATRLFRFVGAEGDPDEPFPLAPANGNLFDVLGRMA